MVEYGCQPLLAVVFLPALDGYVIFAYGKECHDEFLGQTHVGHHRDVMVNGTTADAAAVGKLSLGVVLRHVDDEGKLVCGNHIHHIVISFLFLP